MSLTARFLFAMPRVLFGAARTLDLGAQFDWYNYSSTDEEADARALYADWLAVGEDMASAAGQGKASAPPDTRR